MSGFIENYFIVIGVYMIPLCKFCLKKKKIEIVAKLYDHIINTYHFKFYFNEKKNQLLTVTQF